MAKILSIDPQLESQTWEEVLDETPIRFDLYWNRRSQSYALNLKDVQDNIIIGGLKVVKDYDLISQYELDALPNGGLITVDTERDDRRIEKYEVGARIKVVFVAEEEI